MQSTRGHIVELLKRHGGATVDELSKVLGLASMTIRQHLAILERDSY
ncbi:MAG: DeoR family transcriptional regulator, partial [Chloroflexi bacterium]|nr:DeoR family transcriptional regulator [Chloroflexota bacterium]